LERPQPNAKSLKGSFSQNLSQLKEQEDIDEILLVGNDSTITEGSKSNIFFIKQNQLFTAKKNTVLPGITRQKIIELCHKHNIPCHESVIKLSELKNMEAAFITGTSPMVMPVRRIDDVEMEINHPLIKTSMELYTAFSESDIKSFVIDEF
jgi:branched-chain amino acid aminotransferase